MRVRRLLRRTWKRYLRWPAPLWRLQGRARLALGGQQFTFCIDDANVSWASKVWRGKWEREVTAFLRQTLGPGDVFFDLGAWTGPYALLAAKLVQPGGSVHAFEPDPAARALLLRNIAENGVSNITVVDSAVTDGEGSARLVAPRPGNSQSIVAQAADGLEIPTVSLDRYCRRRGVWPDVLKIDVEGAEAKVFAGGSEALAAARAIVLEVHNPQLRDAGVDPVAFLDRVRALGKPITVLHERGDAGVVNLALAGQRR